MVDISNQYIQSLQDRVKNFNYEKEQKKYADRLSEFNPPQRNYDVFDLATSLSQGLSAQKQTDQPNSIGGGFALGFNQASQEMKLRDAEYAKARREIGLQAARMAMENEQAATKYLDDTLYELAKASSSGSKSSTLIENAGHLSGLRKQLREEPDEDLKAIIQQDIDDVIGLGSVGKYDANLRADVARKIKIAEQGTDVVLTPGQVKQDQDFAKRQTDWIAGERQQTEQNLTNLNEKLQILTMSDDISGAFIGSLPEGVTSYVYPESLAFIGDIRDVVFQSLRATLGAQFTENEGNRLVAAAFDIRLSEEQNYKRLSRLVTKIQDTKNAMDSLSAHWLEYGTLESYEGIMPADQKGKAFENILDSFNEDDFAGKSNEELTNLFEESGKDVQDSILRFLRKREE